MSERNWQPSSTSEAGSSPLVNGPDAGHIETVREAWTSYMEAAYPDAGMGLIQRKELRRAFYMGAWAMMIDLASATNLDEAAADRELGKLWDEINAFVDQVRAGRA